MPVAVTFLLECIRAVEPWEDSWGLRLLLAVIWVNFQPTLCAVKGQTFYSVGAQVGQGGLPSSLPGWSHAC